MELWKSRAMLPKIDPREGVEPEEGAVVGIILWPSVEVLSYGGY
jgi:hypothetical protein